MNLTKLLFVLIAAIATMISCDEETPERGFSSTKPGDAGGETHYSDPSVFTAKPTTGDAADPIFEKVSKFSSEFETANPTYSTTGSTEYESNWYMIEEKYQSWVFKSRDENIRVKDGDLQLTLKELSAVESGKNGADCYIGSGMLRSKEMIDCYGYFEARIKGADLWQGSCPSFWLYTMGEDTADKNYDENEITYNEIDIIEMQQVPSDRQTMSSNLHLGVANNKGEAVTKKAGQYLKMGRNEYQVTEVPDEDYHIYACENRPDSVVFYYDGRRVASKPNYFWHMKNRMRITLSLGVRTPYETYNDNGNRIAINPDDVPEAQRPTSGSVSDGSTMYVDYIRTYKRKDGYDKFRNNSREWVEAEFKN